PPESPQLSRAAAGSIIGIALVVILGALAFNFRQDIGELVIDVGQKISGDHRPAAAPPTAVPDNKDASQHAADPVSSEPPALNGPDAASSQSAPSPAASNPADTRGANSATTHDP